jgi:UDP:flavonoid glycosyltransferase YjiC (YdhE family)
MKLLIGCHYLKGGPNARSGEERLCWNEKIAMDARKRILFLAEGATMTHFVRPVALADSLVSRGAEYDLYLYAPARFAHYLDHKPYSVGELRTMPGETFLANIARGKPMFPAEVLRRYVKEDRELIGNVQPDLVVGDMRLSLSISARLEKVPCAVLMNAYWSPYAKHRSIIPELPLTRVIPPRLLGPLYRATEPIAFAMHVAHMNRVRKEFGVAPLPLDLRRMYTDGDYVLYADVPEFVQTEHAPLSHHYVGICNWSPPTPKPEWWERMCGDPKPKVFVSLGSSGPVRVLPQLLAALGRLPVSVVLSTSGREVPATGSDVYTANLLPFLETAARSALVVSHGGSGGLYPAMAAGTPVLAIPSNADQQLSTAVLEENRAGLGVRVEEASARRLHAALQRILSENSFTKAAKGWSLIFQQHAGEDQFQQFLNLALSPSRRPPSTGTNPRKP